MLRHNQASVIAERYNYSGLVNSVFSNKLKKIRFKLNINFVYKYTICIAWHFHFAICKYDFKTVHLQLRSKL